MIMMPIAQWLISSANCGVNPLIRVSALVSDSCYAPPYFDPILRLSERGSTSSPYSADPEALRRRVGLVIYLKKNMTDQKEKIQFQNFFKYALYYRHSDSLGK